MEESNLVLFDQSSYYVEHLYEYLLHEKKIALNIECFTEKDLFLNFSQSTRIQILIINEYLLDFLMEKAINNIQNIVILQEKEGFYQSKIYDFFSKESVFFLKKYQSARTFLKELLFIYSKSQGNHNQFVNSNCKIIGIYSPVKRCLQTSFAILLGQILAKNKNVLYLNFEPYSGLTTLLQTRSYRNLTDVIFEFNQSQSDLSDILHNVIDKWNRLDYIPPTVSSTDIFSIEEEQWISFLNKLISQSEYQYIILDLSDGIQGLFTILEMCSQIITIIKEDGMAMAKVKQYEEILKILHQEKIQEKTTEIKFPYFSNIPYDIEQLPYSELATYIQQYVLNGIEGY